MLHTYIIVQLPIFKAVIKQELTSELEVNFIALVDKPAIEKNFLAFNEAKKKQRFSFNEEKQIISGPAMIADLPIYRKDDTLGEYYVVFDKASIQSIVQKFNAKGYLNNFNLFHEENAPLKDITILNSFISNEELGIQPMKGFEDVAEGSWFISAKVDNADVWTKIKAGELLGFSVEGLFNYVTVDVPKYTPEEAHKMIEEILSRTDLD